MSGTTIRAVAAAMLTVGSVGLAAAQDYRGWSCADLWVERNQVYRDAGYCFRSQRAITQFGNAGCAYDHPSKLPLSQAQRRIVEEVARLERLGGCRD